MSLSPDHHQQPTDSRYFPEVFKLGDLVAVRLHHSADRCNEQRPTLITRFAAGWVLPRGVSLRHVEGNSAAVMSIDSGSPAEVLIDKCTFTEYPQVARITEAWNPDEDTRWGCIDGQLRWDMTHEARVSHLSKGKPEQQLDNLLNPPLLWKNSTDYPS